MLSAIAPESASLLYTSSYVAGAIACAGLSAVIAADTGRGRTFFFSFSSFSFLCFQCETQFYNPGTKSQCTDFWHAGVSRRQG